MPRYEYRNIQPLPVAEKAFTDWIQKLDEQFANRNVEHRCSVVRNALHELYLGRPYADPAPNAPLAEQAMVHSAVAYARQKDRLQTWAVTASVGPGSTWESLIQDAPYSFSRL